MDAKTKEMVIESIERQYPFIRGVKPTVRKKERVRLGFIKQTVYQFTFRGEGVAPDGAKIEQTIKVTTSESGRILKTMTSR